MELLSENFIEMINQIFNHSNIIATIPVQRISIIDGLIKKYRPTIVQITKASSIKAFNEVIGWLTLNKLIKSDQNNFK
jgi:nucleoside-triphosphatase THEP1